jgi:hypothetical protein
MISFSFEPQYYRFKMVDLDGSEYGWVVWWQALEAKILSLSVYQILFTLQILMLHFCSI